MFLLRTDLCTESIVVNPHFNFLVKLGYSWCYGQFYLLYLNSPRSFMLESILFETVSIGKYLLWIDLCTVAIGGNPYFKFSAKLGFLRFWTILLIIFDFLTIFYVRINHFRKCFNWEFFCYGPILDPSPQKIAKRALQKTSFYQSDFDASGFQRDNNSVM